METLEPKFDLITHQSGAIEQMESALIDKQIATAKRYPRDLAQVRNRLMSDAKLDEKTAASMFYSVPRGGRSVEGPSIRMAEVAISAWGNIRVQSRVVETVTTGEHPYVMVRGEVFDVESNVAVGIEKRRRIMGKKNKQTGVMRPPDDDDVNMAVNSGTAFAIRDATFKVIPKSFIQPVIDEAKKVAIGSAETLANRRAKSIEAFAKMGVGTDKVLALLEKKSVEDIDLADIGTLIGVFNGIRDGEETVDEAFPTTKPVTTEGPKIDGPPSVLTKPATVSEKTATEPKPTPPETVAAPAAAAPEPPKVPPTPPNLPDLDNPLPVILQRLSGINMKESDFMSALQRIRQVKSEQKTLESLSKSKHRNIVVNWDEYMRQIAAPATT